MPLKFTLLMTSVVLFMVTVFSYKLTSQLVEQLVQETDRRAGDVAEQVIIQAKYALVEAKQMGLRPASESPEGIHGYVRHAFEINEGLRTSSAPPKIIWTVRVTCLRVRWAKFGASSRR